jgi:hypothetical protein
MGEEPRFGDQNLWRSSGRMLRKRPPVLKELGLLLNDRLFGWLRTFPMNHRDLLSGSFGWEFHIICIESLQITSAPSTTRARIFLSVQGGRGHPPVILIVKIHSKNNAERIETYGKNEMRHPLYSLSCHLQILCDIRLWSQHSDWWSSCSSSRPSCGSINPGHVAVVVTYLFFFARRAAAIRIARLLKWNSKEKIVDIFRNLFYGFSVALEPINILFCFRMSYRNLGRAQNGAVAISILLPATPNISLSSIIMLASIYCSAMESQRHHLVNIPGEAASVVTCLDYQMAKQGRAGLPLRYRCLGSFVWNNGI